MRFLKVPARSRCGNISFDNVELPVKRVVCHRCKGTGSYVNPAIDGHGLSYSELFGDPDFAESYFSGVYDVCCETCQGKNVVDEVDDEMCKQRLSWWKGLIRYYSALQFESASRMEDYYERMSGC